MLTKDDEGGVSQKVTKDGGGRSGVWKNIWLP